MSPRVGARVAVGGGFPRVSGDEPAVLEIRELFGAFSPREWG